MTKGLASGDVAWSATGMAAESPSATTEGDVSGEPSSDTEVIVEHSLQPKLPGVSSKLAGRPESVRLSNIVVADDPTRSKEDVVSMAMSMGRSSQLHTVVLRPIVERPGWFQVVAGSLRVLAAEMLGWSHIAAIIKNVDEVTAERLALEENLARRDPADKETKAARLHELYEKSATVHHGGDRRSQAFTPSGQDGQLESATKMLAAIGGTSARTARRRKRVGKRATPEVKKALAEKQIDINEAEDLAGVRVEQQSEELAALLARKQANELPIEIRRAVEELAHVSTMLATFRLKKLRPGVLKPGTVGMLRERWTALGVELTQFEEAENPVTQ